METLALISQKGGCGKSTLAVHMAVCAAMYGQRVAIIDVDPQGSAFAWNEIREPGRKFDAIHATVTELPGLLRKAEAAGTGLTIIDTAPHTNKDPPAVAQLADFVLIPARPAFFDLKAMAATVIALHMTKTPRAVVLNAAPHGYRLVDEARANLQKAGVTVLPEPIHQYAALGHAVTGGLSIHEFAPDSPAAAEIEGLYKALAGYLDLRTTLPKPAARRAAS
ncbi:MAG: ParA family protein [Acidobacteria bacterium]|nr:ParA family protein [Acidobacteriota bacterium]